MMDAFSGGDFGAHGTPVIFLLLAGYWGGLGAISGAAAAYLGDKKAWQGALAGAVAGIAGGAAVQWSTMYLDEEQRGLQLALRRAAPAVAGAPAGYFAARDRR